MYHFVIRIAVENIVSIALDAVAVSRVFAVCTGRDHFIIVIVIVVLTEYENKPNLMT